jgi:preprotein translocase SecE subunit
MAIARKQTTSLTDVKLNNSTETVKPKVKSPKKTEKKSNFLFNFLGGVIGELRQVEWPTFGYTVRWSLVIVVFTIFISLFLAFFDNIFTSGIEFATCVSPAGDNSGIQSCGEDLTQNLTLRGDK